MRAITHPVTKRHPLLVFFMQQVKWIIFDNCLLQGDKNEMVASNYAKLAKQADLDIIAWTLERSGPLAQGGGWYYQSVNEGINNDGDMMKMLDVLAQDIKVLGVFSDWPATVTYYANCMNIK